MDEDFARLRAIPPGERVFAVMLVLCLFAVVGAAAVLGMTAFEATVCERISPPMTSAWAAALFFSVTVVGNMLLLRQLARRYRVGFRRWFVLLVLAMCDNREADEAT